MMPLKPRRLSEVDPNSTLALIADVLGEHVKEPSFLCGNHKCNQMLKISKETNPPKFCVKCGTELDWSDLLVKIIKKCPKCEVEYSERSYFCENDGTKLEEKTISKY